jgi:two-component system sensor histidine kinase HydH
MTPTHPQREGATDRFVGAPLTSAAILAGTYTAICALYIAFSGYFAAETAVSIEELHRIELLKGMAFVFATGLLIFLLAYAHLTRISRQRERIVEQERALAAAEGRAMAGIFASSIAHDMGNLLTAVRLNLHFLAARNLPAAERAPLDNLAAGVDELSGLVNRLAGLGRERQGTGFVLLDLAALVRNVMKLASTHSRVRQIRLTADVPGTLTVEGDEALLSRMLINLLLNGADAAGKGGRVEVRLRRENGHALVEVHDSGAGIPEKLRTQVFDPFYTTKPNGTGLGLLSVKVAAEEHHGTVTIAESDLGGASFRVSIPVPGAPA